MTLWAATLLLSDGLLELFIILPTDGLIKLILSFWINKSLRLNVSERDVMRDDE